MKQFNQVLLNMENAEEWDQTQLITFQQAGSILATMGFLTETVTEEHPDYKLYEELWDLMDGTTREGIKKNDLAYVLKVIRGTRDPDLEVEEPAPEGKEGIARMIVFDSDDNLQFRKGGQVKLAGKFRSFYINKLQSEQHTHYPRVAKKADVTADSCNKKGPVLSKKT